MANNKILLIADNTRTAGNFFDNMFNDNFIVYEYDIDENSEFDLNEFCDNLNIDKNDVKIMNNKN
jgi:hypothetical protein